MRVSATWLDNFLLYKQYDWKPLEEVEAAVRREPFPESDALLLGRAFHKVAEGLAEPCGDEEHAAYCVDDHTFDAKSADDTLKHLYGGVHEVKAEATIATSFGDVTLVCVADYLKGNEVWELKTKQKTFDPQFFADAYQWRCYLLCFGAAKVNYILAQLFQKDGIWFCRGDTLPLYPYPALRRDVETLTDEFVGFCRERGLMDYLIAPRVSDAA